MLALLIGLLQLGLFLLLLAGALHLLGGAAWALRRPRVGAPELPLTALLPVVTVQLPICNERFVAERVVRAACALEWPRERLQIQVLDDSDDDTSVLLDRLAEELRAAGHDITVLRRGERRGAKAGNLAFGLQRARGAYVAVFDADCAPPPDTLQGLLAPLLRDPTLAFAQGRWAFLNQEASLLTQLQAMILHGLFLVEQARLSAAGLALQFNGSGGVWRVAALREAGGWLGESAAGPSIAEDLDLSYRARLLGLRGITLPQVAVPTELPATMAAFRVQQRRWVRGGAQVLRGLLRRLFWPLTERERLPPVERVTMLAHLVRHLRQPWLVLLTLWLPLTVTGLVRPAFSAGLSWALVLPLLWLAVGLYYGAALARLPLAAPGRLGERPAAPFLRAFALAPLLLALSLGLSLCLSASLLLGLSGRAAAFVRTPKRGAAGAAGPAAYRAPVDALAWAEALIGGGYALLVLRAVLAGDGLGAVGLLFPAVGYLWLGGASLRR